jgi:hypothetical protein
MKTNPNLTLAWVWILLGFLSGMLLGLFFHHEKWLGGYASLKRRLYRLAHISFFGLGFVNFVFAFTLNNIPAAGPIVEAASWCFIIGAVTMPLCCVVMAHFPKAHLIFAAPVVSLILGGVLTLTLLVHETKTAGTANTITSNTTYGLKWRRRPSARTSIFPTEGEGRGEGAIGGRVNFRLKVI